MGLIDTINAAAANAKPQAIDASWLTTLLTNESSFNSGAVSQTGVVGIAQITQGTWAQLYPQIPFSQRTDELEITGAANLLSQYSKDYNGNPALVATAYNAGVGTANLAQKLEQEGQSPTDAITNAVNYYVSQGKLPPGKAAETLSAAAKFTKGVGGDATDLSAAAAEAKVQAYGVDGSDPVTALPVSGSTVSPDQIAAVVQAITPSLVIYEGLDEKPWFTDNNLVRTPNLQNKIGFPISFQIYFDQAMTVPLAPKNGSPVSIRLNASLQQESREMKHSTVRRMTRTGILLSLWDMQPDVISGSGTTGVFMNALGITDYLSLTSTSPEVLKLLTAKHSPDASLLMNEGLRIAAKDAFMEFLATFRNNGVVWLRKQTYDGGLTFTNQTDPDVWSPATGSTTIQTAARNNDVLTRGYVVMKYRNSLYAGYFKSFTFTMDADKPFNWTFSFVFQVEKTLTAVPVPGGGN
jgi:hypothetical protein